MRYLPCKACATITDPSIQLHMWQQLVLHVVSYGSDIWDPQYLYFMGPNRLHSMYFKDNPGEQIHLQFLRWYTGARRQTHTQIVLKAGNRLPLVQHWLHRPCPAAVEQAVYS